MTKTDNIIFRILDKKEYHQYRQPLIKLYRKAFAQGEYPQYISEADATQTWDNYLLNGNILIAEIDKNLVGTLVYFPLKSDKYFPHKDGKNINESIYIAEVAIDLKHRGKGIGTRLIQTFFTSINNKIYSQVVIRVWEKNTPALSLYKAFGFEETGYSITQTKWKSEKETFRMKKKYLKKLI
ncbi:MAG: GNAT family N-acetyltransferase [Paludibacteraceae bacterium]